MGESSTDAMRLPPNMGADIKLLRRPDVNDGSKALEVPVVSSDIDDIEKEPAVNEKGQVDDHELKHIEGPDGTSKAYKVVRFRPGDPEDPKNFPKARKWLITLTLSWVCFSVAFSSAVITPGILGVAAHFDVSEEVALLTVTLFVMGFGIGRTFTSPISSSTTVCKYGILTGEKQL